MTRRPQHSHRCRGITSLDLSNTGIGDRTLMALAKLPNLQRLYVSDTAVTSDAVAAFKQQRPSTVVSWGVRPEPREPLVGIDETAWGVRRMTIKRFAVSRFCVPDPASRGRLLWPALLRHCRLRDANSPSSTRRRRRRVSSRRSIRSSRKPTAGRATPMRGWRQARGCISRPKPPPRGNRGVRCDAGGARRSRRSVRDRCCSTSRRIACGMSEGRRSSRARREEQAVRAWVAASGDGSRCRRERGARAARRRETCRVARRRPAAADTQPVQQHGARSDRRLQPARRSVSARGFRRRLQEPDAVAGHPAGARRRLQQRGRADGAERLSRR